MKSHYYCRPRFIGSIPFDMSRLQENNNDDDDAPIVSTSCSKIRFCTDIIVIVILQRSVTLTV